MARDKSRSDAAISQRMKNIQTNMDRMYQTTYYNPATQNRGLDSLNNRINANIDRITNYNMNTAGIPSVSKLYSRLNAANNKAVSGITGEQDISSVFDSALGFDDFYSNFTQNRYLVEADAEIDAVCKYFPELVEALDIKKEGVLSADHFSKDFLTVKCLEIESSREVTFAERIKDLKSTYNLLGLIDEIYDATALRGEQFLYVVPYATALSKLLSNKPKSNMSANTSKGILGESNESVPSTSRLFSLSVSGDTGKAFISEKGTGRNISLSEATYTPAASSKKESPVPTNILNSGESFNLSIEISKSGIIESAVNETFMNHTRRSAMTESMASQFNNSVYNETVITEKDGSLRIIRKDKKDGKLKDVTDVNTSSDDNDDLNVDGLVTNSRYGLQAGSPNDKVEVQVPGCVVNKLKREQVIPIYVGSSDVCLGYYYIELRSVEAMQDFQGYSYMTTDTLTSLRGSNTAGNTPFNSVDPLRQEQLLMYISGQLSNFIDKEFVQANQDLRSEIYMILKHNDLLNTPSVDKIKISFVPPEDMIHFHFKLDPDTHRGISDLERALVPAKMYASMYITDCIAQLCRGQDKRVFYVKQNVDTNIAQTLMNTITQIKQGNFGLRQFSSINNVLNITGKFNDFIIPVNAGGDSPVQIEVLPGQQFTDNTERMQQLKEMAINSVEVPFEMISTRNSVDYAMQLSMSSSKFLRKIYNRQTLFTPFLSTLITKLYNYEYKESEALEAALPPPMFLNMANTNQLVDNIKNYIVSVTEYETASMEEDEKNFYYQELFKMYIGTHVSLADHEKALTSAKLKADTSKVDEE